VVGAFDITRRRQIVVDDQFGTGIAVGLSAERSAQGISAVVDL